MAWRFKIIFNSWSDKPKLKNYGLVEKTIVMYMHSIQFFKFFVGVCLIYKVVLVSGIQQNECYIYIHSF